MAALVNPGQPGTCFLVSFSFHQALQQTLELSILILFDGLEGEAIITHDNNAAIPMMPLGAGQGCGAYIHPNWKHVVVTGISEALRQFMLQFS